MKRLIRYLAYLAYHIVAAAVWFALYIRFAFLLFSHKRECDVTSAGCPPESFWLWSVRAAIVISIIAVTVLGFVQLRYWLNRVQGLKR